MEEAFAAKTRYVCRTNVQDKKIQRVQCKTIEIDAEEGKKPSKKPAVQGDDDDDEAIHSDDNSSEEQEQINFNNKDDDEEISTKLVSITQDLTLQSNAAAQVDSCK